MDNVSVALAWTWGLLSDGLWPWLVANTGDALKAGIGTLFGASLAFAVERWKTQREDRRARAAAANLAIHWLSQMYSEIRQYRDQIINPSRTKLAPWYQIPPSDIHTGPGITFDYTALQFLFASKDAGVTSVLALEERRFASLVELVARRSQMHHGEMQAILDAKGIRGSADVRLIEETAGPRIVQSLKDYTGAIVESVDRGVTSTLAAAAAVRAAALPMVGRERIVYFVPNPEPGEPAKVDKQLTSTQGSEHHVKEP